MQLDTADFAPVPPPGDLDRTTLSDVRLVLPLGELDETIASSLILAYCLHYIRNTMSSTKPEVHIVSHCRQQKDRATATGNHVQKIW